MPSPPIAEPVAEGAAAVAAPRDMDQHVARLGLGAGRLRGAAAGRGGGASSRWMCMRGGFNSGAAKRL
jgi:hypothetical protein